MHAKHEQILNYTMTQFLIIIRIPRCSRAKENKGKYARHEGYLWAHLHHVTLIVTSRERAVLGIVGLFPDPRKINHECWLNIVTSNWRLNSANPNRNRECPSILRVKYLLNLYKVMRGNIVSLIICHFQYILYEFLVCLLFNSNMRN